ncbi:MAG TPA: tripartite tricarboxylate transporter TctB family protein, partial [Candidatus Binatia bacterium]
VPVIFVFLLMGALSATRDPLDLAVLVGFGLLGYAMKRLGYPRPPLILGLVLGDLMERYLYRSVASYGYTWLYRPAVIVLAVLAVGTLAQTLWSRRARADEKTDAPPAKPSGFRLQPQFFLTLFFLSLFIVALWFGWEWPMIAKLMPVYLIALPGLVLAAVQLHRDGQEEVEKAQAAADMDEVFSTELDRRTEARRTLAFFAWFVGGALSVWLLGIVITLPLLVLLYAWLEGRESWKTAVPLSAAAFLLIWGVFEYTLEIKWPAGALLG